MYDLTLVKLTTPIVIINTIIYPILAFFDKKKQIPFGVRGICLSNCLITVGFIAGFKYRVNNKGHFRFQSITFRS